MGLLITVVIIIFAVVGLGGWAISIYNRLVALRNNIDASFANIDVILKQRADQIPALIQVVSKAMSHEKDIFTTLSAARITYLNAGSIKDKVDAANQLESALKSVIAISENYPTLISGNSFIELQKSVSEVEDKIAHRREFFNDAVNLYNIGITLFPDVLCAKALGYQRMSLLEISAEEIAYNGVKFND
ncbi:membrane protein [Chania multitudinisentens RB-25]|uniref:Membrane protein n=1 Tax=Chania multitudinisentens RB-25 TaxID=1441930 RepID=W0LCS5_9GAMM|nr:LemA family protein [Chania multitudinisentens]AHG21526.1 membrane protein [Chania multitudinisentens RB-25]